MGFHFAVPSEILKPYVKQYWALEHVVQKGTSYTQRIVPNGLPELILYLGYKPQVCTGNRSFEEHFLLNGQQNDFYDIHIADHLSIFSILFQPEGLSRFFKLPLNELSNLSVPLQYINKELYSALETTLSPESSFREKISIVERELTGLLTRHTHEYKFSRIQHIIADIRQAKGNIGINELASNACLSRKQFERFFSESVGISPKQYLKTIRFQYAIHIKSRNDAMSLTELALESGYYDQAHCIHDFKLLSGLTPKQFFSECETTASDFFNE